MKPLATELLHDLKQKANFWKVATIVCLTLAIAELVVIVFQKGKGIKNYGKRKNHKQFGQYYRRISKH